MNIILKVIIHLLTLKYNLIKLVDTWNSNGRLLVNGIINTICNQKSL